ncbi:MAG TPA: permease, partial [Thiotrichales bacterium]|nr:permease [Thiotrichales bacterium]
MLQTLLFNIWQVFLETAFWLLLGLLAAGAIKTLVPATAMQRWVGGHGIGAIFRAALFGAPLPLCSCGVLPTAIGLHRAGASKEATIAFLISTPETSVDSITVTYALMGPVMAIYRPVAALTSAILTGLLTTLVKEQPASRPASSPVATSCCASAGSCGDDVAETEPEATSSCCGTASSDEKKPDGKLFTVLHYAGAELLDDISKWMAFGLVLAGIIMTFIPPDWLAQWGQGLTAMLGMLVIGIPMYICASASTPVAAGLLLAGVSPGAVLIFLLVGPATNIASFVLLKQELGLKVTLVYLAGIALVSLAMGLLLEWLLLAQQWQIEARIGHEHAMLPELLSWLSAGLL